MPSRILDDECMGGGGMWDDTRFGGFGDFGGIGIFGGCVDDRPFLKGGGNQWAWKIKTGG